MYTPIDVGKLSHHFLEGKLEFSKSSHIYLGS